MVQKRSGPALLLGAIVVSLAACALGVLAMAWTQGRLIRAYELRQVLIASEAALALPALLAGLALSRAFPEMASFRPLPARGPLICVGLGLALWGLSLGLFEAQYVLVRPPLEFLNQFQGLHDQLKPVGLAGWIFSITAIALTPALCEEIVFRGLLAPVFRRALGTAAALVISAGLFGLIHIDAMPDGTKVYYRVPFAFLLGVILAKVRFDSESLWPPMIAHATLNATTFVVVLLSDESIDTLPDPRPLLAAAMLAVGGVFAHLLLRQLRPAEASSARAETAG